MDPSDEFGVVRQFCCSHSLAAQPRVDLLIDQLGKFGGIRLASLALLNSHRDKDGGEEDTDQASHRLSPRVFHT